MITCPNCNKEFEDGTKFCDNCGKQLIEIVFCQNCGKQTNTEAAFCQNCGASLLEEEVVEKVAQEEKVAKKQKTKKPFPKAAKVLISVGVACVAVVLVAAMVLSLLFTPKNSANFTLYFKDKEVYFTNISKIEPFEVTTNLLDDADIEKEDLYDATYRIASYFQLSKDGEVLFFIDKMSEDSEGASLYYRYVNKPEEEPVKIDSDVTMYAINDAADRVTYLKGEDATLYQHNLTDKEKIAGEVRSYEVSDDGKKIGYVNRDGEMYLKYDGEDKEKLDSEVTEIHYINKEFDTVYYSKDDSLYKMREGKDKEKIASEVSNVISVYESGEIYYCKSKGEAKTLLDYVEDDMKATDDAMVEPEYPEYPSLYDYDTWDEYYAARDAYYLACDEYDIALDAYYDKLDRDDLREELSEETVENYSYSLCFYNGKEEKVLAEAITGDEYGPDYVVSDDKAVVIYSIYNQPEIKKVKLSEIEYIDDVEEMIKENEATSSEKYIAVKGTATAIEQTTAKRFNITPDGKAVYFFDDVSEENEYGDLYKMEISGEKPKAPKLYDSDVYFYYNYCLDNGKFVYFKEVKDEKGDLYIDKELIDYDVSTYYHTCISEKEVLYMVDWNEEKDYGTLKLFKDGESVKIADDVRDYELTPNNEILYLYEYSSKSYKGELFVYKNGESEKIDDDVISIIPIYDYKYRGGYYGW